MGTTCLLDRRQKDTVRTGQTVYTNICQDVPYPLSFELRVLEALLSETARSFASKTQRLRYICERIVADIDQDVADLHRLVPIQRCAFLPERIPLALSVGSVDSMLGKFMSDLSCNTG